MANRIIYTKKDAIYYPLVNLKLFHKNKSVNILGLVDSGANISLIRPEIARFLDIPIGNGAQIYLTGLGGRILGYIHNIQVESYGKKFKLKTAISNEVNVSFNILGRDNFFENFEIVFNEKDKILTLK